MSLDLQHLNTLDDEAFVAALDGVYEHSPWIARRAAARRPFASLAALKLALAQAVSQASLEEQLGLIRAHPELAGKAAVAGQLTAESTAEQSRAGLQHCSPAEFERLQALNKAYGERFGWPFILAVRGPRGLGLSRQAIIEAFERRLHAPPDVERAECLRNIHRIAEIRLDDKFAAPPVLGNAVLDAADHLARHSETPFAEQGQLCVTYMTPAHQAVAQDLTLAMQDAGFDDVSVDALGNVVGLLHGTRPDAPRLLTGSHYDTVRNAGRHDGRLGVLATIEAVRQLKQQGRRLPFTLELVAFAEEEGQRFAAPFLSSSALVGRFDPAWLDQQDAEGIRLQDALRAAGHPGTLASIQALRRDPARYLGYVELHIEQGPVLCELDLPLGVVTSINGSRRYLGEITGLASHAGTTPMDRRRDAAAAAAELVLAVEHEAQARPGTVGTVGLLEVPGGSINVVPGRCRFSLDLRAGDDAQRDALDAAVRARLQSICERRGLQWTLTPTVVASAAPSDTAWQARWEAAVQSLGLPVHRLPSGAGHDAMKIHEALPQAMLFVRGGNLGISHNPLETVSNDDADLAVRALLALLDGLSKEHQS